jgi:hypothetical protein
MRVSRRRNRPGRVPPLSQPYSTVKVQVVPLLMSTRQPVTIWA